MCFIDLEGRVSFAYVPVRDQNLVVRDVWFVFLFFISFKKVLKWKAKWQNKFVCVFYIKEKWLEIWKNKNKRSLDFGNQGLFMKIFFCVFVICMFFVFE